MTRRTTGAARGGEAAHQRMRGHLEEIVGALSDRLDDKFDRLDTRLSRMEGDIGAGQLDRQTLRSDINETRRDLGELRDAMNLQKVTVAPGQIASAKTAITEAVKSPAGRLTAWIAGVTAAIVLANNIPDGIRFVERMWDALAGREVRPLEVVVPPKDDSAG